MLATVRVPLERCNSDVENTYGAIPWVVVSVEVLIVVVAIATAVRVNANKYATLIMCQL